MMQSEMEFCQAAALFCCSLDATFLCLWGAPVFALKVFNWLDKLLYSQSANLNVKSYLKNKNFHSNIQTIV